MSDWAGSISSPVLVLGCGSIGKRHISNMKKIGISEILAVDPNPTVQNEIREEFGLTVKGMPVENDFVSSEVIFVTSPNCFHFGSLEKALRYNCHVFMEKPIAVECDSNVERVVRDFEKSGKIGFLGSNFKFHPLFKQMHHWLSIAAIGRVLSGRIVCGHYLPFWRPGQDYRQNYAASREMGGGVLLDSHELIYLQWLCGKKIRKVFCRAAKLSDLDIETEDTASLVLELEDQSLFQVHLDYCQRVYRRSYEFYGSDGSIFWDFKEKKATLFGKDGEIKEVSEEPKGYLLNEMYLEEVTQFFLCIEKNQPSVTPLSEALETLRVIDAAKVASSENKFIEVLQG